MKPMTTEIDLMTLARGGAAAAAPVFAGDVFYNLFAGAADAMMLVLRMMAKGSLLLLMLLPLLPSPPVVAVNLH